MKLDACLTPDIKTNNAGTWVIFLGWAAIGLLAGICIGAWLATKRDLIAGAEEILKESASG